MLKFFHTFKKESLVFGIVIWWAGASREVAFLGDTDTEVLHAATLTLPSGLVSLEPQREPLVLLLGYFSPCFPWPVPFIQNTSIAPSVILWPDSLPDLLGQFYISSFQRNTIHLHRVLFFPPFLWFSYQGPGENWDISDVGLDSPASYSIRPWLHPLLACSEILIQTWSARALSICTCLSSSPPATFKTSPYLIRPSMWIGLWLVSMQWVIAHRASCIFTEIKLLPNAGSLPGEAELTLENGTFQKHHNLMDGHL